MMWDPPDTSYGSFYEQSSQPQQIVYPSDFDRYIDAEFDKSPFKTINPALLSLTRDPPWETSSIAPLAGTYPTSGSPPSLYSDVSSPPTSPECVETHTTEATTAGAGDRLLTDAEVDALLLSLARGTSSQEANDTHVPFRVEIGMHTPAIISQPAGVPPAHLYPSGIISMGSEQSQQRYYGAAVADAYSQETGMQVDVYAEGDYGHSNEETSDIPAAHLYPIRGDVVGRVGTPASSSETREVLRTQLVERPASKKFPCPRIDCTSGFNTKYNLREHIAKVHEKQRPWRCDVEGCPKAVAGYSRKPDLTAHRTKKHPEHPFDDPPQPSRRLTQAMGGQDAPPM